MERNRIVVIGAGYAGSATAKALDADATADVDLILIEPKDAFVNAAASLRALVQPPWAPNAFFRYDNLLRRGRVIHDRATVADANGVTLASGEHIRADYLVLATGSDYPYPAKPDTDSTDEALRRLHATHGELDRAARVLIVGAGPVGLELAGEIKSVWPDKQVTVVDPAPELLAGFDPELRADLHGQLDKLGVELRLGTRLTEEPPTSPGVEKTFTVGTAARAGATGDVTGDLTADLWFRCYGVSVNSGYLAGGLAAARTPGGQVRVTDELRVEGHDTVYALGDLTDLVEAKMAGYAMKHAEVVAANILAQVRGEQPTAVYRPSPIPSVLLPLGPGGGVGQVPSPDGPTFLSAQAVAEYKGADLFRGRFAALFETD